MSEWYGAPAAAARKRTAMTRVDEPTAPESEMEAPPTEEPAADE
ncbi:MAG TPA: hypothetical protein VIQ79_20225 [Kribbella sp.]